MNKCKQILSFFPLVGLICVIASVFFSYSTFQQIALIFTGVTYALDYVVNQRWKTWSFTKEKWTFVACIVYFLLLPIWVMVGIDTGSDTESFYERLMPFGILGLIGLMGLPKIVKVEWVALTMLSVVSIVTTIVVSDIGIESMFTQMHDVMSPFNQDRLYFSESHMQFNMYANMALILGFASIMDKQVSVPWRIVMAVEMLITTYAVFVSEGRAGLVTMLLVVIVIIMMLLWQYRKWLSVTFAGIAIVGACFVLNHSMDTHYSQIDQDPRLQIWRVAIQQIEDKPFVGYGMSRGHEEFVLRGQQDKGFRERFYDNNVKNLKAELSEFHYHCVHPHNAFLEAAVAYGIFGALLLIFIIISPLFLQPYPNRRNLALVSLVFFIQAMFEHMGHDLNPMLFMLVLLVLSPRLEDYSASK